jgi:PleD family two-component response regulator
MGQKMNNSEQRMYDSSVQTSTSVDHVDDNVTSKKSMNSVLIVDDELGIRSFLQKGLARRFGLIEVAEDVETANELRKRCHFDLIITDIRLPGRSGVDWVTELREQGSTTAVIFITAYASCFVSGIKFHILFCFGNCLASFFFMFFGLFIRS